MQQKIKEIKHLFMTYRNGAIADVLRQAGMTCYRVIFGLNVPQIANIANQYGKSLELAESLWEDNGVRESRILATYLFPKDAIDEEYAFKLIEQLQTKEEADMLCFRLLKQLDFASQLIEKYNNSEDDIKQYCAKMLSRHLS